MPKGVTDLKPGPVVWILWKIEEYALPKDLVRYSGKRGDSALKAFVSGIKESELRNGCRPSVVLRNGEKALALRKRLEAKEKSHLGRHRKDENDNDNDNDND